MIYSTIKQSKQAQKLLQNDTFMNCFRQGKHFLEKLKTIETTAFKIDLIVRSQN